MAEVVPPESSLHAFVRSCLARVAGDFFAEDALVEECIQTHEDLWRMLYGMEVGSEGEVRKSV